MFDNCIPNEIPWLSLEGVVGQCKVISVYDADTVTIAVPLNEKLYKVRCRLLGIDSAEKRTKNIEEKKVANEATEWLRSQINNQIIWVKCGKWDKYGGRVLGTLYMTEKDMNDNSSVNMMIVDKGYAYKYDGKKKQKFEEWFNKLS
jgi:endonuclease YncB( thermonuclease family)